MNESGLINIVLYMTYYSLLASLLFCIATQQLVDCPSTKVCVPAVEDCSAGEDPCIPHFKAECVEPGE